MFITVTLYDDDGQDRFQVLATDADGNQSDVTSRYEVAGTLVDGREGFVVLPRSLDDGTRHPTGAEL